MNKLSKLANKASEMKTAPLVERKKSNEKVQLNARISKEMKQRMDASNVSFQRFVNENLENYIQKEIERLKSL